MPLSYPPSKSFLPLKVPLSPLPLFLLLFLKFLLYTSPSPFPNRFAPLPPLPPLEENFKKLCSRSSAATATVAAAVAQLTESTNATLISLPSISPPFKFSIAYSASSISRNCTRQNFLPRPNDTFSIPPSFDSLSLLLFPFSWYALKISRT